MAAEEAGLGFEMMAMVPIFDMLNHHHSPNCAWDFEDGALVIRSVRGIAKGAELTIGWAWSHVKHRTSYLPGIQVLSTVKPTSSAPQAHDLTTSRPLAAHPPFDPQGMATRRTMNS